LGGALEVERLRRELHPLTHAARDLLRVALEEDEHLVDHRAILALRLRENARRLASLDEVVEARPLRHLLRHVEVARADREDALHHIERSAHRADVGVRSEVAAAVVDEVACHPYAWK